MCVCKREREKKNEQPKKCKILPRRSTLASGTSQLYRSKFWLFPTRTVRTCATKFPARSAVE